MAYPLLSRRQGPPPADDMSQFQPAGKNSYISSKIAAQQSSISSEQEAQSTADSTEIVEVEDYSSSTGTTITFGSATANPTGTAAVTTDSNGSTITSVPAKSTGSSALSSSTVGADHVSDSSSHHPSSSAAVVHEAGRSGPSPGLIAAAVIIPLVVISAVAFGLLCLRRRRRRRAVPQNQQHHHPMKDRPSGGAFVKETSIQPPHDANAPILTNTTNNAYYTGLSTPTSPASTVRGPSGDSARTASAYYEPPPPAYARTAPPGSTYTLPQLSFPNDPFMDPVSPVSPSTSDHTSPTGAALAALEGRDTGFTATSLSPHSGVARPNISRSGTVNSVTSISSDTYSDTASLHSARPARRSGGAQVAHVVRTSEYAPGYVIGRDPFEDPKDWRREV